MKRVRDKLGVVQNLGLVDRCVRTAIGWFLIGAALTDLYSGAVVSWHGYAILVAVYPILTGILGWDPIYNLVGARTCELTGRNRCGTFPFEVSATLGRNPECKSEYDCSLGDEDSSRRHAA